MVAALKGSARNPPIPTGSSAAHRVTKSSQNRNIGVMANNPRRSRRRSRGTARLFGLMFLNFPERAVAGSLAVRGRSVFGRGRAEVGVEEGEDAALGVGRGGVVVADARDFQHRRQW